MALRAYFSSCISSMPSATGTWKTTMPGRHPLTEGVIDQLAEGGEISILDIGVSDGATSTDLIIRLGQRFIKYYATDIMIRMRYELEGKVMRFYSHAGQCLCITTPWLVVYPLDAGSTILHWWARRLLQPTRLERHAEPGELNMIQPKLRQLAESDPRVVVREYDLFSPWDGHAVNIVKVANVFNRACFSEDRIVLALQHIHAALSERGHLVITENCEHGHEKVTVFERISGGFRTKQSIGRGSDISGLIQLWRADKC